MKNIKNNFVSLVVMGYAFTSISASANVNVEEINSNSIGNDGFDMKMEADSISYVRNRAVLISEFDDGSELTWIGNNDVEMYGQEAPLGFNSAGLMIKSIVDKTNTYSNEDTLDIRVSAKDFPLWVLSKYSDLESVKSGIQNIVVSKNIADKPLSFEIIDQEENILKLKTKNGNLVVS